MDGPALFRHDRAIREIDRLAEHVENAAQRLWSDGHRDRPPGIDCLHASLHAVGRLHRDGAHAALAQVLLDLRDDVDGHAAVRRPLGHDAQRVVDFRQMTALELHVDHRADHLHDLPVPL
jgi:hypothetical protein